MAFSDLTDAIRGIAGLHKDIAVLDVKVQQLDRELGRIHTALQNKFESAANSNFAMREKYDKLYMEHERRLTVLETSLGLILRLDLGKTADLLQQRLDNAPRISGEDS